MADECAFEEELAALDEALGRWNRAQSDRLQESIRGGTPPREAVEAILEDTRAAAAEGRGPVDRAELQARIIGLCRAFRDTDDAGRMALYRRLAARPNLRAQFYGFIHDAAAQVRATHDPTWIDLALAAAALEGGRLDWRDLYVALGELWLAAESARINPRRRFAAAAAMADDTVEGGRSARGLLMGFEHSAHLHSIKRRR